MLTDSPYDILDLPFPCTEADVKKRFRKISLLIHPDKFKHEQGSDVSTLPLFYTLKYLC